MKGGERTAKRCTAGSALRKTLTDITNIDAAIRNDSNLSLNRLIKENEALVNLIEKKNKIIEVSSNELVKLRLTVQKLQKQNSTLAQTNTQLLGELNTGKDRLKALQHEILCKEALLQVKQHMETKLEGDKLACKSSLEEGINAKPIESITEESERCKFTNHTSESSLSGGNAENKRRCMRRQSAKFKSVEQEPSEDLFEIKDVAFPISKEVEKSPVDDASNTCHGSGHIQPSSPAIEARRSSVGRPLRRAAEKVESYKEKSLRTKMRRS